LGWDDARFDTLVDRGDDEVDRVIAEHAARTAHSDPMHPRQLVATLARRLELPPEAHSPPIKKYLQHRPALPEWACEAKLAHSAAFFDEFGPMIGTALFCASLPEAYCSPRGARVLTLASGLVTDPVRRVYETAQMVLDSMTAGGLDPDTGAGYKDIRRVRLMHAAVRYLVRNDPDITRTATLGPEPMTWCNDVVPLNQEDLFGALMTFTQSVFESLDRYGADYTDADKEAYLHAWSVVGYLLGLDPELLPVQLHDAGEMSVVIRRRDVHANADAKVLGTALRDAMEASIPIPMLRWLPSYMIHWSAGPEVARHNGISTRQQVMWPFSVLAATTHLVGLEARHVPVLRTFAREFGYTLLASFVNSGRGERPPFSLPRRLEHATRRRARQSFGL
jgi:hypothetical protein